MVRERRADVVAQVALLENTPPPTGRLGAGQVAVTRTWPPAGTVPAGPVTTAYPLSLAQTANTLNVEAVAVALFSSTRQLRPDGTELLRSIARDAPKRARPAADRLQASGAVGERRRLGPGRVRGGGRLDDRVAPRLLAHTTWMSNSTGAPNELSTSPAQPVGVG